MTNSLGPWHLRQIGGSSRGAVSSIIRAPDRSKVIVRFTCQIPMTIYKQNGPGLQPSRKLRPYLLRIFEKVLKYTFTRIEDIAKNGF